LWTNWGEKGGKARAKLDDSLLSVARHRPGIRQGKDVEVSSPEGDQRRQNQGRKG